MLNSKLIIGILIVILAGSILLVYTQNKKAPEMSAEQAIQQVLADKYSKNVADVHITITKQNNTYAGGSVLFGTGGPGEGGMFLARKVGSNWEVVFDGNGSVDCNKMRQDYGFPDDILKPSFCD